MILAILDAAFGATSIGSGPTLAEAYCDLERQVGEGEFEFDDVTFYEAVEIPVTMSLTFTTP